MKTQLVCGPISPGTPNKSLEVLDFFTSEREIHLTVRRFGKWIMRKRWLDDEEGRIHSKAMFDGLAMYYRLPTPEELATVPELMVSADNAEPEDVMLCIQWDIDGREIDDALELRNQVLELVEAILAEAELLIDFEGASIGAGTVEMTFSVVDFASAKTLLCKKLTSAQKAHNCRIFDEATV